MNLSLKSQIVLRYGNQRKFAQALDVCESTVSQVVTGRINLSPGENRRWAELLGIPVGELFPEEARR